MKLTERKEKIIQAVIDSYTESCEPVSSADIKANYIPSLSTATIRNELAALEDMGYLDQPHTSAGRVPTANAYKLYVEKLMPRKELSSSELDIIKKYFNNTVLEIGDLLRSTAKVISEITNLAGIAYVKNIGSAIIKNIKIIKITDTLAIIVIVTDRGVLKDSTVTVSEEMSEDYLRSASEFISKVFANHTILEICNPDEIINQITNEFRMVFDAIVEVLKNYVSDDSGKEIVLEGGSKLLEQPEFSTIGKARAVYEMFESKEKLAPVLKNEDFGLTFNITEDVNKPECAIVTANLEAHGVNIGKAGVIGPIRMDYPKIVSVLDYIGKTVGNLVDNDKK